MSCPKLRPEAFSAERLDEQLNEQAWLFVNNPLKNKVSEHELELSKIFEWFETDFTKNGGSVVKFIQSYTTVEINPKPNISYLAYDWNLNAH